MSVRAFLTILLVSVLLPTTALACSWGDPSRPLQDEVQAYYDADVVFLARIGPVDELPPEPDFPYATWAAPYQVLEIYRGAPVDEGLLASEDQMKPGLYGVPPNNCVGGKLWPGSEGTRVLVFGQRKDRGGQTLYRMALSSTSISDCEGCEDVLDRVRLYGKFHQADLRPEK